MPRIIKVAVSLITVVLLLFSACIAENAVLSSKPRRYKNVMDFSVCASISNKNIECIVICSVRDSKHQIETNSILESRKKGDGAAWFFNASWMDKGKNIVTSYHKKSIQKGYEYRLKGICKIKDKNGKCLETIVKYSKIVSP